MFHHKRFSSYLFYLAGAITNQPSQDLWLLEGCRRGGKFTIPAGLSASSSRLDWKVWQDLLSLYPDRLLADYVVQGLRDGFRVGFDYQRARTKKVMANMRSALEHPEVVRDYLTKECAEGRIFGPFIINQFSQVHVSRFGVIPKGNSGKWRLILDLSSPEGQSVNDGINPEWCSLSYVSVDDAVPVIRHLGQNTLLTKVDIKSAYRMVPVHPDDRLLLGMQWENNLYVDGTLPFGLRSAPRIFTAIADALEWRARFEGTEHILHYLDDFLIMAPAGSPQCNLNLTRLLALFDRLHVPVASDKVEGPSTCLKFLGIEIDTQQMCLQLLQDKLVALKELVTSWLGKKSCSVRDLHSLVGKLQHACKVVQPGRTFLQRMFELLKGRPKKQHMIRLNTAFRSDLMWWYIFLEAWNGIGIVQRCIEGKSIHRCFWQRGLWGLV